MDSADGRRTPHVERDHAVLPQALVRDVELVTQYLMGKHFHRGFVDPDLGAWSCEMI